MPRKGNRSGEEPAEEEIQDPEHTELDPRGESLASNDEAPNLATAIQLMTEVLRNRDAPSKKTKAKEPDTFDGSDSRKLNNFIILCSLYFRSNPAYEDDAAKVNFALSYLRGTALEYFEPEIIDSDNIPSWIDDWEDFVKTLRTQFGPIDPTGDAESGIDHLKMNDNQRIIKYNVEFNKLAVRTHWDEGVLRHRYYSGLAERIKDIMGQQGKPSTLEGMKKLAHSIDSRHWERLGEKSRSSKGKSDDKSDHNKSDKHKSDDKNKNQPSGSNNSGNNPKKNKSNKPAKSATASTSSTSTNLLVGGHLRPSECGLRVC